ncbi:MAG: Holliday junction branch migration protein RuvA [Armatimonadota bacterium]
MIGLLRGTVVEIEGNLVLIEVAGVGYEVIVADSALGKLNPKAEVMLYTRQIFREDGVTLCGFLDRGERRVFDLLLEVKGCGPRVAQALIGQVGADLVSTSIIANDAKTLSRATGVGQRLAERIILELRPKIEKGAFVLSGGTAVVVSSPDRDLVEALATLGYRRPDAELAASKVDMSLALDERIKLALQLLKKG